MVMPEPINAGHVIAILVLMLLPGLGLTLAMFRPGRLSVPGVLALALGLGYSAIAISSFGLALAGALRPLPAYITWASVTIGAWWMARRGVRPHTSALLVQCRSAPWPLIIGLATLSAFAVVRWTYTPVLNLAPTTLRYWADAVEVADAGRIPSLVLQWGTLLPPATSKIGLSSFYAFSTFAIGRDALPALGVASFVVSTGLGLSAWALLWTLGLRWTAGAAWLWLFANQRLGARELTQDLTAALAENWGRMLMLIALTAAVVALRPPDSRNKVVESQPANAVTARGRPLGSAVAAGLLVGVGAGTHLVPTVMALAFAGAYALARLAVDRSVRPVLKVSVVGLVAAAVVGGLILTLPPGELGFQGASNEDSYDRIRTRYGLPDGFDPSHFIVVGDLELPPLTPYGADDVGRALVYRAVGADPAEPDLPLGELAPPFVLAGIGLLVMLVLGNPDLRALAVATVLFAGVIVATGIGFAVRYELFVLERFAQRRLLDYWALPFVLLIAGGVHVIVQRLDGRKEVASDDDPGVPRWRPVSAGVLALVIAAGSAAFLLPRDLAAKDRIAKRASYERDLLWVADNVPCEGWVLADRRTLATFETMTGKAAVLEGMGPHIRPLVLERAIGELLLAREFFLDPEGNERYLRDKGVAAIVITAPFAQFGGWTKIVPTQQPRTQKALQAARFLELAYRSDSARIYLVKDFIPNEALPRVTGRPGFECAETSV